MTYPTQLYQPDRSPKKILGADSMNKTDFREGVIQPLECYKEGWEMIKSDYWLLFAICLVGMLIGVISMYVLMGAMICGIFYCFLQKLDTGRVSLDDLWRGFKFFAPGLLVMLAIILPMLFVYGVVYVPLIAAAMLGTNPTPEEMLGILIGSLAVDSVLVVLMVCFHTLLLFSFPLIIDRGLPAVQSMKTSARAVWRNLSGIGGLIGIQFVLMLGGLLTCGLGIYFLTPIMIAGLAVGYRKIFPSMPPDGV